LTSDGQFLLTGIQAFSYVPALVNISSGQVVHTFATPNGLSLSSVRIVGQTAYVLASKAIYSLSLAQADFGTWKLIQNKFRLLLPAYIRVSVVNLLPELTKLTPTAGPMAGNTTVYALAIGLTGSTAFCLFGGVISVPGQVLTDQLMSCVTPPSPVAGNASVQVSNDNVNWSNPLTFTYTRNAVRDASDRLEKLLSTFAKAN
jgi:hypothetical protein